MTKGVAAYRAANPGSKIKNSSNSAKLKKGSKLQRREENRTAQEVQGSKDKILKLRPIQIEDLRQARRRWKC